MTNRKSLQTSIFSQSEISLTTRMVILSSASRHCSREDFGGIVRDEAFIVSEHDGDRVVVGGVEGDGFEDGGDGDVRFDCAS